MPVNRNALIRYTTIDKCLRNRYRKWTLDDLIEACSNALYEFEGIDSGVGRRTVQLDIQTMRSDKLGYNAPIIVIDRKYYTYEDSDYSITNLPLTDQDLGKLNDAIDILKQFKEFSHFSDMTGLVNKLENKLYTEKTNSRPIIHMDKNENLKGIEYLDELYKAILNKKVLNINYQSFTARKSSTFYLSPYWLKEYNNRWFLVGLKGKSTTLMHLALDRIKGVAIEDKKDFVDNPVFHPDSYYKHAVGVTVNDGMIPRKIQLRFNSRHAPYVVTKPLHHSQEILESSSDGIIISVKVVPNYEFDRLILGFGSGVEVLSPPSLRDRIALILKGAASVYEE